ncbi:hypothetical protein [Sanguibacter suaedae]|uniref:Uncharacterized protein n=1 Tax=Sanguibacter suaedae TaxID=2795737 RepID=A0A934IBF7_9MICO|nr:hypothetical protein [Sanguibacter suaedae]MBI9115610.1 hypothetical protein [Sanguibacter suaedae]
MTPDGTGPRTSHPADARRRGLLARADAAGHRPAVGTSATEGRLVITIGALTFAFLAVTFQLTSLEWGGLIGAAATLVLLAALPFLARARRDHERVHPRGYRRRWAAAAVWAVVVAGLGAYLWRSGLVDVAAPVWLTTAVALAAVAPLLALGAWLVRSAR